MATYGYEDLKAVKDEFEKIDYILRAEMVQRPGLLILQVLVGREFVATNLIQIAELIKRVIDGKLVLTVTKGKYIIDIMNRPAQLVVVQM